MPRHHLEIGFVAAGREIGFCPPPNRYHRRHIARQPKQRQRLGRRRTGCPVRAVHRAGHGNRDHQDNRHCCRPAGHKWPIGTWLSTEFMAGTIGRHLWASRLSRPLPGLSGGRACLAGTTTEGDWAGVRPSSGAAASDRPSTLETSKTPLLADVAAPEDGRTPVVRPRCALAARPKAPLLTPTYRLIEFAP